MRNVNVNSIGEYIREQREQAKISMRQLAQSAGVSSSVSAPAPAAVAAFSRRNDS